MLRFLVFTSRQPVIGTRRLSDLSRNGCKNRKPAKHLYITTKNGPTSFVLSKKNQQKVANGTFFPPISFRVFRCHKPVKRSKTGNPALLSRYRTLHQRLFAGNAVKHLGGPDKNLAITDSWRGTEIPTFGKYIDGQLIKLVA